jgi:hypothetical protein
MTTVACPAPRHLNGSLNSSIDSSIAKPRKCKMAVKSGGATQVTAPQPSHPDFSLSESDDGASSDALLKSVLEVDRPMQHVHDRVDGIDALVSGMPEMNTHDEAVGGPAIDSPPMLPLDATTATFTPPVAEPMPDNSYSHSVEPHPNAVPLSAAEAHPAGSATPGSMLTHALHSGGGSSSTNQNDETNAVQDSSTVQMVGDGVANETAENAVLVPSVPTATDQLDDLFIYDEGMCNY